MRYLIVTFCLAFTGLALAGEPPPVKGFRTPPRIKGFTPAPCCSTCPTGACACPVGACPNCPAIVRDRFTSTDGKVYELSPDGVYREVKGAPVVASQPPFSAGSTRGMIAPGVVGNSTLYPGSSVGGYTPTRVLPAGRFGGTNCTTSA